MPFRPISLHPLAQAMPTPMAASKKNLDNTAVAEGYCGPVPDEITFFSSFNPLMKCQAYTYSR
jgi:hypothetical protein